MPKLGDRVLTLLFAKKYIVKKLLHIYNSASGRIFMAHAGKNKRNVEY